MTSAAPTPLRDLFAFQATMRLDDGRNMPETARDIIIDWFVRKLQKATKDNDYSFPSTWATQRIDGKEASIESLVGTAPSGAAFWAAQLEHKTPNRKCQRRYEAALAIPQGGQTAELSLRLSATQLTREDVCSTPYMPFVVMDLAQHLTLKADGYTLGTQQNLDRNDPFAAKNIAQLILSPHRTKPVLLVSYAQRAERERFFLFEDLFKRTRGSAHVFICPTTILRNLEEKLGRQTPQPAGHISLYPPQLHTPAAVAGITSQTYRKDVNPTLPQRLLKEAAAATLRAQNLDDIAPHFAIIQSAIRPSIAMATLAERPNVPRVPEPTASAQSPHKRRPPHVSPP